MEILRGAARRGNTFMIEQVLQVHPDILQNFALQIEDNPVHIAAKHGHVEFVRIMLTHMPNFANVPDRDGFSPVHLAAANGHRDVVEVLLEVDFELCRPRDKDGWTPLHRAILKSRIGVIELILERNPNSIEDLTHRKESCLHIAIKYKRCEVFNLLVEFLCQSNRYELIINLKEMEGNSVLHTAASEKLFEVVEILLVHSNGLDINNKNADGLTALNLCDRGMKDRLIEEMLSRAGAERTVSLTAFMDQFAHSTLEMRNFTLILPAGIVVTALQVVGSPLEENSSTVQPEDHKEAHILDVLLSPGKYFRIFYGALLLTILFTGSIFSIILSLWSFPTRKPLIVLVMVLVIYYFISLASKLSNFTILCGSSRIPANDLVWVAAFIFFLTVPIAMNPKILMQVSRRKGTELMNYVHSLNQRQQIPI